MVIAGLLFKFTIVKLREPNTYIELKKKCQQFLRSAISELLPLNFLFTDPLIIVIHPDLDPSLSDGTLGRTQK